MASSSQIEWNCSQCQVVISDRYKCSNNCQSIQHCDRYDYCSSEYAEGKTTAKERKTDFKFSRTPNAIHW
ncbi:unnamed protein product [Rotaria sordida]|uniref:Uncharacterized protein n=1 Tax=Rotaria sordida TaxID=392033 RepID=A0A815D4T0_9BILA|nr:unnamed protein product [Rotaria sordida]CAF1292254.1 unnamed protein product [Rotaria sordida]